MTDEQLLAVIKGTLRDITRMDIGADTQDTIQVAFLAGYQTCAMDLLELITKETIIEAI